MTKLFVTTLICASLMCVVRGSPPTTTTPMLLSRIQLIANKNSKRTSELAFTYIHTIHFVLYCLLQCSMFEFLKDQSVILEAVHRHFSPNDINFVINRLIRGGATSALAERLVNRLINLVFESTVFGPVYASHVDLHVMHMIDELKDASVNPVELVIQRIKVIDEILPKSSKPHIVFYILCLLRTTIRQRQLNSNRTHIRERHAVYSQDVQIPLPNQHLISVFFLILRAGRGRTATRASQPEEQLDNIYQHLLLGAKKNAC